MSRRSKQSSPKYRAGDGALSGIANFDEIESRLLGPPAIRDGSGRVFAFARGTVRLKQLLEPIDASVVWIRGHRAPDEQLGIRIATVGGTILTMGQLQCCGGDPYGDQKQFSHFVAFASVSSGRPKDVPRPNTLEIQVTSSGQKSSATICSSDQGGTPAGISLRRVRSLDQRRCERVYKQT